MCVRLCVCLTTNCRHVGDESNHVVVVVVVVVVLFIEKKREKEREREQVESDQNRKAEK